MPKHTSSSKEKIAASRKTRRAISQNSQFKAIDDVSKVLEGVFKKNSKPKPKK